MNKVLYKNNLKTLINNNLNVSGGKNIFIVFVEKKVG